MAQSSHLRYRSALGSLDARATDDKMRRIIVAGLLVATAMVAVHAVTQLIDFRVFNLRIRAFNADKHDSVFGLASLLAQAGLAAASWWRGNRAEGHRRAWIALAAILVGLVLIRGLLPYNSKELAVPLVCVFWLLVWLTWRDPRAARTVVWVGLILMVASLLLHEVGPDADSSLASDYTWSYQITGVVKHGAELAGWILLITGVIAGIADRRTTEPAPPESSSPESSSPESFSREMESVGR